jgi:hypothetical protein
VKVPKAQITVEKTDLTDIKTPLTDILDAFRAFQIPEPIATDLSAVEELLTAANELLKKIEKKNFGGGGGGGGMVPYKDPVTGFSVQVETTLDGKVAVSTKPTDKYGYCAKSETISYRYYYFEDKDTNWYILRKNLTTEAVDYAIGSGGYSTVFVNSTSDPSGTPTFASYGNTFN